MLSSKQPSIAADLHGTADINTIALAEALSAPAPNSRSPAFAVQEIFRITKSLEGERQLFQSTEEFLILFPTLESSLYEGKLSWDRDSSSWSIGDGVTIDTFRIQQDVTRWYIHGWDFSRQTRDPEFQYPEDQHFGSSGEGVDALFHALMPLKNELTRRIFIDKKSNRLGYCDVYRACDPGKFITEIGFFDDIRTHRLEFGAQPFWQAEGLTIPALLRDRRILSYRVHNISARRSKVKKEVANDDSWTFF